MLCGTALSLFFRGCASSNWAALSLVVVALVGEEVLGERTARGLVGEARVVDILGRSETRGGLAWYLMETEWKNSVR